MISVTWEDDKGETVKDCFRKAGWKKKVMRKTKSLCNFLLETSTSRINDIWGLCQHWQQCPDWWKTDKNRDSGRTATWTDQYRIWKRRRKLRKQVPLNQAFITLQIIHIILSFFHSKLWNGSKGFRLYGKKMGGPLKSLGVKVHCIWPNFVLLHI